MELRDYVKVIVARKWLIVAAVVLTTAIAVTVSVLQRPLYEAQSGLLVKERSRGSGNLGALLPALSLEPERSVRTHIELIKGASTLRLAAREVGGLTAEQVSSRLSVEALPQGNLLYVRVRDADAARAAKISNAVASVYAESNRSIGAGEIENARRKVWYRLRDTEEDVLSLRSALNGSKGKRLTGDAKRNAEERLKMALGIYQMLAEKEQELRISESTEPGEITFIERAIVPKSPVSPKPVRNGLLGLMLGLSLGMGAAFLAETLDTRIKTAEEAQTAFDLPVLGQIPADAAAGLFVKPGTQDEAAEAFRSLRTGLSFVNYRNEIKRILVTSASALEGKTTTSINLAAALVQAGYKVLVIDCDLRKPGIHRLLELPPGPGIAAVISGQSMFEAALTRHKPTGLEVMCGSLSIPPNPSELLNSRQMDDVLDRATKRGHYVILDSPPVLPVTDAVALAPKVHGVLLVAAAGETTKEQAHEVAESLRAEHIKLLGVVFNKAPAGRSQSYYDYYQQEQQLDLQPE